MSAPKPPRLTPAAELAVVRDALERANDNARKWAEKAEATLKTVDPEALALSQCIKALDALVQSGSTYSSTYSTSSTPSSKGDAAIARVVAHLSSRYRIGGAS